MDAFLCYDIAVHIVKYLGQSKRSARVWLALRSTCRTWYDFVEQLCNNHYVIIGLRRPMGSKLSDINVWVYRGFLIKKQFLEPVLKVYLASLPPEERLEKFFKMRRRAPLTREEVRFVLDDYDDLIKLAFATRKQVDIGALVAMRWEVGMKTLLNFVRPGTITALGEILTQMYLNNEVPEAIDQRIVDAIPANVVITHALEGNRRFCIIAFERRYKLWDTYARVFHGDVISPYCNGRHAGFLLEFVNNVRSSYTIDLNAACSGCLKDLIYRPNPYTMQHVDEMFALLVRRLGDSFVEYWRARGYISPLYPYEWVYTLIDQYPHVNTEYNRRMLASSVNPELRKVRDYMLIKLDLTDAVSG